MNVSRFRVTKILADTCLLHPSLPVLKVELFSFLSGHPYAVQLVYFEVLDGHARVSVDGLQRAAALALTHARHHLAHLCHFVNFHVIRRRPASPSTPKCEEKNPLKSGSSLSRLYCVGIDGELVVRYFQESLTAATFPMAPPPPAARLREALGIGLTWAVRGVADGRATTGLARRDADWGGGGSRPTVLELAGASSAPPNCRSKSRAVICGTTGMLAFASADVTFFGSSTSLNVDAAEYKGASLTLSLLL